jgi:hypothetical protein
VTTNQSPDNGVCYNRSDAILPHCAVTVNILLRNFPGNDQNSFWKNVSWWHGRKAKFKKWNFGKWTVLSMQNGGVKFIVLTARHSVATSDGKKWLFDKRNRRIMVILKYAHHWEVCVCGKINSVYWASVRYKHTYEYAPVELHFRTLWTYFPSIYGMIHDVVTFCLEQYSNSILHAAQTFLRS